jgi:mono/diheme cytochrome c family protein
MSRRAAAVVGLFDSAEALLKAAPLVRAHRLGRVEAYTPYPVHGLSKALGLRPSPLGYLVMGAGLLGAVLALLFQWWTSAVDYPVHIGGKALFSWQAFVPIVFEVMVLFAAVTAGLGMLLLLNRLPLLGHPFLRSEAIAATTRDRFALAIEAEGGVLIEEAARAALQDAGALSLEVLLEEERPAPGGALPLCGMAAVAVLCIGAGVTTHLAIKLWPVLPPMSAMETQAKMTAFRGSDLFEDGIGMRVPVAGTVARGHLPADLDAVEALASPLAPTAEALAHGRGLYETFCTVCHGPLGTGKARLGEAYEAVPANLHGSTIRGYTDGRIFRVISGGKGSMPGYAGDLTVDDRWAIVHHVRALQRSQNAKDGDLP